MLKACFAELPKLRAFHFTDFRSRARWGESYGDLCSRLFGNTLEPEILGNRDWNYLHEVLDLLRKSPRKLESLTIGDHMFQKTAAWTTCVQQTAPIMPLECMRLIGRDLKNGVRPAWIDALCDLKTLRIGMYLDKYVARDQEDAKTVLRLPRAMLETASSTLTELTLTTEHLIYQRGEKKDTLKSPAATLFQIMFPPLKFDHLHILELQGWAFEEDDLRDFLIRHASTLRYLHLIDNNLHVPRWHLSRFMDHLGAALQLAGVELFRLSIPDPTRNPGADSDSEMASGSDAESGSSGENHIEMFPAVCRTLPLQSSWDLHFEGDVLQQRPNRVIRRARPGRTEPYQPKWWKLPADDRACVPLRRRSHASIY